MPFNALQLSPPLVRALADEGYTTPTPIQSQAIPPVMEGRDLLGCAQTGTGKTAAFALPILHRLYTTGNGKGQRREGRPRALILSPTRELATQIGESFAAYGRHTGLSHTVVFGGVNQFHQVKSLRRGVDIVVATPGRLLDLMQQRHVFLDNVSVFVLDEADRMLDMGFIAPIRKIAAALPKPPTAQRQTLLFSATMPREIMHLADSLLHNPVKISVTPVASTVPLIEQSVYMVPKKLKQSLLEHLLKDKAIERALVFTRTKHGADKVSRRLKSVNVNNDAIHGNKSQNNRQRALDGFRTGRLRVLVATDVAARGIDIDNVTHVFNFDMPHDPESYVHRIGRTGRAGASGIAVAFCDNDERAMLRDIERLINRKVSAITKLPELTEAAPGPGSGSASAPKSERDAQPAFVPHSGQKADRREVQREREQRYERKTHSKRPDQRPARTDGKQAPHDHGQSNPVREGRGEGTPGRQKPSENRFNQNRPNNNGRSENKSGSGKPSWQAKPAAHGSSRSASPSAHPAAQPPKKHQARGWSGKGKVRKAGPSSSAKAR